MPRISYVDPDSVTDRDLARHLADARAHGTPRLESQAIRAHVPAVLRTFSESWQQVFREGVLDHRVKELARVLSPRMRRGRWLSSVATRWRS